MKRSSWAPVWALCRLGACLGLALPGAPARAQPAPGGRAQVYRVTEADFTVPQVKLPNAAVARRINQALLRLLIGDHAEAVDSLGTPRQQLRQAVRECCPGQGAASSGLTAAEYKVLLNQHFLLSFEFSVEFTGAYSWGRTEHATFDLRTGRLLRLADLVADLPVQLERRMEGAINRRIGASMAEIAAESQDPAEIADLAERFHWNKATRRVNFKAGGAADEAAEISLDEFALTPDALLLFYRAGLPHAIFNFEPDETYHFPYGRLQPRGPLVPVAQVRAPISGKSK